jgi:phosphoglycolate phosphatase
MIRAVLFDLDGTLTDSGPGIIMSFRHAFARLAETGGPSVVLPGDEDLRFILGPPMRDSFARFVDRSEGERLFGYYREHYKAVGAVESRVYDGVTAALDLIAARGMALHVATSKNEPDALAILDHFGLSQRFASINGSRLDGARGAKHELIGDTLAAHGLAPHEAAMIGDREFDMAGARATGVLGVGALWGYGSREELLAAGAGALATTPQEAAEIVLKARDIPKTWSPWL